jgi:chromate transporter
MATQSDPSISHQPSRYLIFVAFLRLGITAFGGPAMVAYIRKMAVVQKGWLEGVIFDDGVALCQAIPGATAMQVAAYTGFSIRGASGALSAFVGFGLPAFFLMMVLSALYVSTSELPPVKAMFLSLQAIIVAMIAYATISFGRTSFKHWIHVIIAGIAAVLFIAGLHPIIVIAIAAIIGISFLLPPIEKQAHFDEKIVYSNRSFFILLTCAVVFFILIFIVDPELFTLASTMSWIDLFAFGGGYASLPLMLHEVVEVHSWLDSATFINGLALGQVTPGPIVITATFVGYLSYGILGGIVATIGIFIPSFLLVVGIVPYYDRLRSSQLYQKMFQGILFSFVGLLLSVTIKMALAVSGSWFSVFLATGAFVALLMGAEILWVVIGGLAIAGGIFLFMPGSLGL